MKRSIALCVIAALVLVPLVAMQTLAHPGNTDAQGGHTDYSTGEYHWHHGEKAHQHYDMDGDGDLDCPLTFVPKSTVSAGNNEAVPLAASVSTAASSSESSGAVLPWTLFIASACLLLYNAGGKSDLKAKVDSLTVQLRKSEEQRRMDVDAVMCSMQKKLHESENNRILLLIENEQAKRQLEDEYQKRRKVAALLIKHFGSHFIGDLADAPSGSIIDSDNKPCIEYGDNPYTLYVSHSRKIHRQSCRFAEKCTPVNAIDIARDSRFTPCELCKPDLPDVSWVDNYKEVKSYFEI